MFKMMWRMERALGLKNFCDIIKKFQAGGASLEKSYRESKKQFVQIELLAVKKEYQGKGFMRPLVMEELMEFKSILIKDTTKEEREVMVWNRQRRENIL